MKQNINITINKPCSEKFNQFKQTLTGGFCSSCRKNVIDFRQMSDDQVVKYFSNKTENTCGYFNNSQLSRVIERSNFKQSNRFRFVKVAAIAFLSLTSLHHIQAQERTINNEVVQTSKEVINSQNNKNKEQRLLSGKIVDKSSPLPGANILLKGTAIGTSTNFDGEFEFPKALKEGDILVISYIGFVTQEVKIKNEQTELNTILNINMQEDVSCFLMGEVEVNEVYKNKTTLWQKIKNIF